MLSYTQFLDNLVLVEAQERKTYEFTEEQFFEIDSLMEALGLEDKVWKNVRQGAKEYFGSTPEEQKSIKKNADELRTNKKVFTQEKTNAKLRDSAKHLMTSSNLKFSTTTGKIPEHRVIGITLAPSTSSGVDVCPAATKECSSACLGPNTGHGRFEQTTESRKEKTKFLFSHPAEFFSHLDSEITTAKKSAARSGQKLAVRLNVASDIPFEHLAPDLFKKHSDVQFYDYTKLTGRLNHKKLPENYHLTLSSTGLNHADSNWEASKRHLDRGGVVAMVFNVKPKHGESPGGDLPTHVLDHATGKRYRVIDGDSHDLRFLDHRVSGIHPSEGVIAGLRIKGGSKNAARAGNFAVKPDETGQYIAHSTMRLKDLTSSKSSV